MQPLAVHPVESAQPAIAWLGKHDAHDTALVGGKAAQLSRLAGRHRVPPGFCLTTRALHAWTHDTCPPSLEREIEQAYAELLHRADGLEPWLAVRSSGVDEDGSVASFAGQLETVLGVRGFDRLLEAVRHCRDSARASRVTAYRRERGLEGGAPLAVLVQVLVPADVALVAFSANPVSGARDEVVINAAWGLGESVVSGATTPDTFVVKGETVAAAIGSKERMTIITPGGSREVPVPRLLRGLTTLSTNQAREVASLARSLEAEQGWPVDIECAIKGLDLYLLQCRPITTLAAG